MASITSMSEMASPTVCEQGGKGRTGELSSAEMKVWFDQLVSTWRKRMRRQPICLGLGRIFFFSCFSTHFVCGKENCSTLVQLSLWELAPHLCSGVRMLKAGPWSVTGHYSQKNTGCARTHGNPHGCTDKGVSPPSPTENLWKTCWKMNCYWIMNKSHTITRFSCHPIPSFDSEPRSLHQTKAFCIHSRESFTSFWRLLLPLSSRFPSWHGTSCSNWPWTALAPWLSL